MATPKIRHMKWWGWGDEHVSFTDADKPKLWPYLQRELGLPMTSAHRPFRLRKLNCRKRRPTSRSPKR